MRTLALATLAASLALAGCASAPAPFASTSDEELGALIAENALAEQMLAPPNVIDDEMRAWLEQRIPVFLTETEKLQLLLNLMHAPKHLGLTYTGGFTGTAREVFDTREFNCLSFSHLFVGLARELGVEAYYLDVEQENRYRRDGDLVINTRHVTAGYNSGGRQVTVEFNLGPRTDYSRASRISDRHATALYYSNRGAELLTGGDAASAVRFFATALRMEPALASGWVNLGVALRRDRRNDLAEAAYRQAIDLDPDYLPAYGNLGSLFRLRGEAEAARAILAILDQRDNRNPFLLLALGDMSLEDGQLADARRFYRRAYRLARATPDARAALGLLALAEGDSEVAREWLEKARETGEPSPRIERLANALGEPVLAAHDADLG